jgi:hypothetical protein
MVQDLQARKMLPCLLPVIMDWTSQGATTLATMTPKITTLSVTYINIRTLCLMQLIIVTIII